ncbi:YceD family protein [Chondromyces crocatus]|uniref:DUF177 domain-containing protein n=1 Tax=Chondromyces crocatus TaxID=52 RepID=A0A0K1EGI2_CHOCO|nr:DUF177 domain-containing protein [Chondromyces crocatus]AKT39959.1 uncharacterized protein CMC5_041120 [Chondromyces crocatus]
MPLLSYVANDIDITGTPVDATLPESWLTSELSEAEAIALGPGTIKGRLSRSGPTEIVVRGRVGARVTVPCARCLGPAQVSVDAEMALLLLPAKAARHAEGANGKSSKSKGSADREPEYEFSSEEADQDVYDGEIVVLDGFVREAILLELPSFPLCSEACPGIGAAVLGSAEEDAPSSPPEQPAEERPASIADLRDRFAQRSGRIPGPPALNGANGSAGHAASLSNETLKKKSKKE